MIPCVTLEAAEGNDPGPMHRDAVPCNGTHVNPTGAMHQNHQVKLPMKRTAYPH